MDEFYKGDTIICNRNVKNDAGTYVDPATSMQIQIDRIAPHNSFILAATNMTKDSTGKYHYDFQTTSMSVGEYEATYIATDGTRISQEKDRFRVK